MNQGCPAPTANHTFTANDEATKTCKKGGGKIAVCSKTSLPREFEKLRMCACALATIFARNFQCCPFRHDDEKKQMSVSAFLWSGCSENASKHHHRLQEREHTSERMLSETQVASGWVSERIWTKLFGSVVDHLVQVVCASFSHCEDHATAGFGAIKILESTVWILMK